MSTKRAGASAPVPACLFALLLATVPAAAQDAQYWAQQYGTRSELLGGAVVGSPQDLSTTFYNPGGLARLQTETFLLSANAFEWQRISAREPSGRFEGLANDNVGTAPSLFTGLFPRNWTGGTLAYSFLTRTDFELRIDNWRVDTPPLPGLDAVGSNFFVDHRLSEQWGGLTWSRPFGRIGAGVSLYGVYRSQRARDEILSQPIPSGTLGVSASVIDDYSYWHARMLAKFGVYWEGDRVGFGASFTTRGLGLFGSGRAAYYRNLVPVDSTITVPVVNEAAVQNELDVDYRSPASIAIGGSSRFGRSAIHVAAEWFEAIDRYEVLDASAFPDSGLGSSLGARLTQQLDSVINVAIGYEYSPRERLTLYASFLTDFSAVSEGSGTAHSISRWDILQGSGGAAFRLGSVDFTIGLSFGGGSEDLHILSDTAPNPFQDGRVRYRRLKAFIGFEFIS